MVLGLMPFGSFEIGLVAEHYGAPFALRINGFIMLGALAILLANKKKINGEDSHDKNLDVLK